LCESKHYIIFATICRWFDVFCPLNTFFRKQNKNMKKNIRSFCIWLLSLILAIVVIHSQAIAQKIGITNTATFTPNYLFHIHDNVATSGTLMQLTNSNSGLATTDGFKINLNTGKIEFVNQENAAISFFTNSTERMFISSTGNVGIGTTNPAADLDIGGSTANGALRVVFGRQSEGNSTGSGTFLGIRAWETQVASYNGKMFSIENSFYGDLNSSIEFYRGGSTIGGFMTFTTNNGTERMRIDGSGNIGIGTTNPLSKLSVGSSSQFQVNSTGAVVSATGITSSGTITFSGIGSSPIVLSNGSGVLSTGLVNLGTQISGTLTVSNGGTGTTTFPAGILYGNGTNALTSFAIGTPNYLPKWSATSPYLTTTSNVYDNGTNVGIGTTSPNAKLDIGTTSSCCATQTPTLGISELTSSNGRLPWIQFHTGGYQEAFLRLASSSRTLEIGDAQNVGVELAIMNNAASTRNVVISGKSVSYFNGGNVGIGTATPGYTLDLNTGTFAFGNGNVRTQSRDDAGLQGNAGAQSGFFETSAPSPASDWPVGASSWWHLIDCRHSNNSNNYALQIAGSFFDQKLYFRKTNGSATQAWTEILTTASAFTVLGQGFSQSSATPCTRYIGDNTSTYSLTGTCATGYTTGTWFNVSGLSVNRTITAGNNVSINVHIRWKTDNYSYYAPETIWFRILRDGTEIARSSMYTQDPGWYILEGDGNIFYYDAGVAGGSHTYSVQTAMANSYSGGTESYWIQDGYITVMEIH
jgi:hypothetical protein